MVVVFLLPMRYINGGFSNEKLNSAGKKMCCAGRRKTNCLRLRESSILQKQRRKEKGGFLRCFPPWLLRSSALLY